MPCCLSEDGLQYDAKFQADLGTWVRFKAVDKRSTLAEIALHCLCRVLYAVSGGALSGCAPTTLPASDYPAARWASIPLDVVLTSGMNTRLCRSPLRFCAVLTCLLLGGAVARTIRSGEAQQTVAFRRHLLAGTPPPLAC